MPDCPCTGLLSKAEHHDANRSGIFREVVAPGSYLVSVFTLRGRNNVSPLSCPASFFLFFQGWSCYLTVTECVGVWRTGFVMAHLNGFGWGQSNWLFEGLWFALTWPCAWLDPQLDEIK